MAFTPQAPASTSPVKEEKKFRVVSFAYQFKSGSFVIKADKYGIYTPANEKEKAFLEYQVKMQRIAFS